MSKIRIVIVDDHTLMRSGLKLMLANQADIEVIGEAADAASALQLIAALKPDIVLLDISMPDRSGIDCIADILKIESTIKIILLTMYEDPEYLKQGFALGAVGYVLKKAADDALYQAIRTVYAGSVFFPADMSSAFIPAKPKWGNSIQDGAKRPLSEQEKSVLRLIAMGYSNVEIAEKLIISTKTVETYKYRVMEKLDAKKRSDLVKYALKNDLINREDGPPHKGD